MAIEIIPLVVYVLIVALLASKHFRTERKNEEHE
jgi:hypothetical protein